VILTVPSGAEIRLNATDYGTSPVKLEQLETGVYTLTITKGGFETVDEQIEIRESKRLAFTLKPIMPSEFAGLTAEERLRSYEKSAQESFDKGSLAIPYQDSALYYAALILADDPANQFGLEMRDRIRGILIQSARSAAARGDVGQAQEIYNTLIEQYPDDEEARLAQIKLDAQLSQRRGEVRELVRKADEALRAGDLLDPPRANAYYYSKEALAIDRTNKEARAIRGQINYQLTSISQRAADQGDYQEAVTTHEQIVRLFPDDQGARERLRQLEVERENQARANDPAIRRVRGLENYRDEKFREAIPDLEFTLYNGRGGPEVVFSLARSYHKLGQLDKAAQYYRRIEPSDDDAYRSAIAALGDIAYAQGNATVALDRYKEARRLGGSALYTIGTLYVKIESI
jgi:tetratricopeptide (TPR) repeat protein